MLHVGGKSVGLTAQVEGGPTFAKVFSAQGGGPGKGVGVSPVRSGGGGLVGDRSGSYRW